MEIDPNNYNAVKWYGICVGANGQFQSLKEKIKCGVIFRDQMNKAIQLKPDEFTLYSLKGRYQYEVRQIKARNMTLLVASSLRI